MSPTTIPIDAATPEQIAERIQSLRAVFENHSSFADRDLKRFLVARQYDVEKAKAMLENYVAWRADNKADDLPEYDGKDPPFLMSTRKLHGIPDVNYNPNAPNVRADFAKFYPATGGASVHGYDKKGRPIYIERLGGYEVKQFADNCNADTFRDFSLRNFEFIYNTVMGRAEAATGKPVEQVAIIFDCTGMGIRQFHIPGIMLLKVLADLLQNIYPERFGKLYIVNAPVFFNAAWAIIKVWLDKRIIEKVQVLGSDYAKILNKDIDHHQFPDFLGGSCTCSHLDGGCVPPTKNSVKGDVDAYLYKMAMKKANNTHEHEVAMPEGGKLNFKFASSAEFKLEIKCAETDEMYHEVSHTEASGSIDLKPGRYVAFWKSDSLGSYKATTLQYTLASVHNIRKVIEAPRRVSNVDSAADITSVKGMRLSGTETIIGDDIFYDALDYFETA